MCKWPMQCQSANDFEFFHFCFRSLHGQKMTTPKAQTSRSAGTVVGCIVTTCPLTRFNPRSIHVLPKDREMRCKWLVALRLGDKFKTKRPTVCEVHFRPEDYERDMMAELMGTKPKSILKSTAVPSRFLPKPALTLKLYDTLGHVSVYDTLWELSGVWKRIISINHVATLTFLRQGLDRHIKAGLHLSVDISTLRSAWKRNLLPLLPA